MYRHLGLLFLQVLLVIGLQGDKVLRVLMLGPPHNGEGTLSDLKVDLELIQLKRLLIRVLLFPGVDQSPKPSQCIKVLLFFKFLHLLFFGHFVYFLRHPAFGGQVVGQFALVPDCVFRQAII